MIWTDWIKHDGRKVPVANGTLVQVRYEHGDVEEFVVDTSTWREYGSAWQWGTWSTRIVEYRHPKPKSKAMDMLDKIVRLKREPDRELEKA